MSASSASSASSAANDAIVANGASAAAAKFPATGAPVVVAATPVTMMITRHIAPDRYSDFQTWMRQGEILAAGFPGFLGSGVLQPPEGGDQFQIVLRFHDEASLARWEKSLPRRMWLERGAQLVRTSHVRRVSGMDAWFGPAHSAPPRWKQAISIWVVYFPTLLLASVLFQKQLAALTVFWRVLLTTSSMTPVLSFILIPLVTRLLHGWLHPGQPRPPAGRLAKLLR